MKVLLLCRYTRMGASSRLRSMQYIPFLESNNLHIEISPLFDNHYLQTIYTGQRGKWGKIVKAYFLRLMVLLRSGEFDLVWLEKELLPWLPAWIEQLFGVLNIPYIVDYDDAIFHKYDINQNRWIRWFLGAKIDRVMRAATLVLVGNRYLENHALKAGAEWVELLPTVVDLNRYPLNSTSRESIFTIGWIGTPKTAKYLSILEPVFRKVCADETVRLLLVGSGPVDMPGINLEIHDWSEQSEAREIASFDIGIMPLLDGPWEQGKCGYKLIQYMACGKPVIASPVGVNRDIVDHNITGMLAVTHDDWINALNKIMRDREIRIDMGKAARDKVEREYSLDSTEQRMLDLIHRAGSKN